MPFRLGEHHVFGFLLDKYQAGQCYAGLSTATKEAYFCSTGFEALCSRMRNFVYLAAVVVVGRYFGHLAHAAHEGRHASMLSRGCGEGANAQVRPGRTSVEVTMQSNAGGGERRYLLHLPVGYSSKSPSSLILSFHGKGQTSIEFEDETQLSNSEFNSGAIVVYPEGIKVRSLQLMERTGADHP